MPEFKSLGEIVAALIESKRRLEQEISTEPWDQDQDLVDEPEFEEGRRYKRNKLWLEQ